MLYYTWNIDSYVQFYADPPMKIIFHTGPSIYLTSGLKHSQDYTLLSRRRAELPTLMLPFGRYCKYLKLLAILRDLWGLNVTLSFSKSPSDGP